jgi:hypothetical protein
MVTGTVLDTDGNDFTVDIRFEEPPPEPPDTSHDIPIQSRAEQEAYRAILGMRPLAEAEREDSDSWQQSEDDEQHINGLCAMYDDMCRGGDSDPQSEDDEDYLDGLCDMYDDMCRGGDSDPQSEDDSYGSRDPDECSVGEGYSSNRDCSSEEDY